MSNQFQTENDMRYVSNTKKTKRNRKAVKQTMIYFFKIWFGVSLFVMLIPVCVYGCYKIVDLAMTFVIYIIDFFNPPIGVKHVVAFAAFAIGVGFGCAAWFCSRKKANQINHHEA